MELDPKKDLLVACELGKCKWTAHRFVYVLDKDIYLETFLSTKSRILLKANLTLFGKDKEVIWQENWIINKTSLNYRGKTIEERLPPLTSFSNWKDKKRE